jgi:N-acetylneuraminic acid mutarotase
MIHGIYITGSTVAGERIITFDNTDLFRTHNKWYINLQIPASISNHTLTSVGDKIYLIGGETTAAQKTVRLYDPQTDSWTAKANAPVALSNHKSVLVDNQIYVVGGNGGSIYANSLLMYDIETDTWATKTNLSIYVYAADTLRDYAIAAIDGKIYLMGGGESSTIQRTNYMYDTLTNTWTTKKTIPAAISNHTLTSVGDKIYLIGGETTTVQKTVRLYDPQTDSWTTKANAPVALSNHKSVLVDNQIYVVGGNAGSIAANSLLMYDMETDTWATKTNLSIYVYAADTLYYYAIAAIDGKIYLMGGIASSTIQRTNYMYTGRITKYNNQLYIVGDSTMKFNEIVYLNGNIKPANTEFQTTGICVLTFPETERISGTIREKIESSVIFN